MNVLTLSKYCILNNCTDFKTPTLTSHPFGAGLSTLRGCDVKVNVLYLALMRKRYLAATISCAVFLDTQYLLLVISYYEKASSMQIFYFFMSNHKFFSGLFQVLRDKRVCQSIQVAGLKILFG